MTVNHPTKGTTITTVETPYAEFFAAMAAQMPNPPTAADLSQIPCPDWCDLLDEPRGRTPLHELPEPDEDARLYRQHSRMVSDAASSIMVSIVQEERAESVTGPATYSPPRIEYAVEHNDNVTPPDVLTGHQARELAAYLGEAADDLDRIQGDPGDTGAGSTQHTDTLLTSEQARHLATRLITDAASWDHCRALARA
jgi:hypothetical protein